MAEFYTNLSVKKYTGLDGKLLTYRWSGPAPLPRGSLAIVPFRNTTSPAVVYENAVPAPARRVSVKAIERLLDLPPLPEYYLQLADWLMRYYAASPAAVWQTMLPAGLGARPTRLRRTQLEPAPLSPDRHTLSAAQSQAVETITMSLNRNFLLHGTTGSGKTEVYLRAAETTLARGQSVLILVPEISLTPQTIRYFATKLGRPVLSYHSKLTVAARRRTWQQLLTSDQPQLVVGARSALFLPFHNLGLIVVDEEHESSYKQTTAPRYHAVSVAAKLAELVQAKLILGSATPALTDFWLSQRSRLQLLELPERISGGQLAQVEIIKLGRGDPLISEPLRHAISQTLLEHQQVLLFLNQRGSAQAQLCTNCGFLSRCPRCDSALTFHATAAKLRCHSCGYRKTPPAVCPDCGQAESLLFIGAGTEKIESEVKTLFPEARVARLDRDAAKLEDMFAIYERMRAGEIDILIGTQMIARGLDLPKLRLVGVVLADTMLYIPDFTAAERTFQLLAQVIGRSGRRDKLGRALIQTYWPQHPAIAAATKHDFADFYQQELASRERWHYPPFRYLLNLSTVRKNSQLAYDTVQAAANQLRSEFPQLEILGPAQPLLHRSPKGYRWQLTLKSTSRRQLAEIAHRYDNRWTIDLDPITIV